ncbi:D-alanyl-D-alanine carboxypeptidase/D-alanyl-D-alanine endopeptidase [Undibacterium flavidum]|uniref:D-alanyl-D-alanine carboxypeptidase/D-alanyl-D-alanine-endopeptidase n=1 Tax=Undibacterium flavidum TaxID=2762297 RepID=A0ABR6Y672_9BURK|nr:D-alanyl-D-alanine carboxypeptidase/D-alanyl-D-alanine-endopeptidase [Undibacterium flavidum]MBC3872119.1 D-alanyl-D-alanine carboxypeptidase/D-alanyl-D-alanine-endopeptidase [Undibacterium flavidum]
MLRITPIFAQTITLKRIAEITLGQCTQFLGVFSVLVAINACLVMTANAQNTLPPSVENLLKKAGLKNQQMQLLILPANSGVPLLNYQAENSVSPASTLKLLTTFIALDELGPNFRWKTQIYTDSTFKDGILNGKLYIKGGGDPNFTWDKLSQLLRQLRQQGLREIRGDLVLDRSYFQPNRPELNAPIFDENPDAYYNVIPDALLVHSNISAFSVSADNNTVDVKLTTPMDNVRVMNQMTRSNSPCSEWKNGWLSPKISIDTQRKIDITINGTFPKNCRADVYLNLIERNAYIASVFKALWQELGGNWQGNIVDGVVPTNANLLLQKESESLLETIRIINKYSDNAMARILFLTVGAESALAKNFADTSQTSNAVVREWFTRRNIDSSNLLIENGSGLSRLDRISAWQLASILRVAANSNWYPEFASSLPIVGIDGSMRNRLKASKAEARARIKTGYLKNVMAVAGYVRDVQDQDWILVAIVNTDEAIASKAKPALDEAINWLANGRP